MPLPDVRMWLLISNNSLQRDISFSFVHDMGNSMAQCKHGGTGNGLLRCIWSLIQMEYRTGALEKHVLRVSMHGDHNICSNSIIVFRLPLFSLQL